MTINCHPDAPRGYQAVWREPPPEGDEPYSREYRTCSWCGSLNPEDLLKILDAGGKLEACDWKYGWPHKFYVKYPNAKAGQECCIGRGSDGPIMDYAPANNHGKWYNAHLIDVEGELFDKLTEHIHKQTGVRFERDEAGVKWSAIPPSM